MKMDAMNDAEPSRRSSVWTGIEYLAGGIGFLEDEITRLQDRISSLTTPSPISSESSDKTSTPANSEMGARLGHLVESLNTQLARLNATVNSIDL